MAITYQFGGKRKIKVRLTRKARTRLQEPHVPGSDYSVAELANERNLSEDTIRTMFRNEPGVIHIKGKSKSKRKHPRGYVTLRIPEAVADRVFKRQGVR